MPLRFFALMLTAVFMIACSGCESSSDPFDRLQVGDAPPEPIGKNVQIISLMEKRKGRLGNACTMINDQEMAYALGITREELLLNNATPATADRNQVSCFYKWDDPELANAGIFVQLLKNPLGEDYAGYITQLIEQKRVRGEQDANGSATLFEELDWGDDGSYSVESGKYFWRLGDEVAFFVAFNTLHEPQKQYQIATKIATQLTKNFVEN